MYESQEIRHYQARSTEERRRMPNRYFFTSRSAFVKLPYIHSFDCKLAIEFDGGV